MKQLLLLVALLIGSLAVQAQSAVESHDVTAAVTDSVRIVPNFNVGDSRTYLVSIVNRFGEQYEEISSVKYHFTVESIDNDHIGMYFIADEMKYEMPQEILTVEAKMILDFFSNKGFRFSLNRHDLTVDSISASELKEPFKDYLSQFYWQLATQFTDSDQAEIEKHIKEVITDDFLNERMTELLKSMISTFTDQYGYILPLGDGQWIEDVVDEMPIADPIETDSLVFDECAPDFLSYADGDDGEAIVDEHATDDASVDDSDVEPGTNDSDEDLSAWDYLDREEGLPDFKLQKIHKTTTTRRDDGSIQYTETVIWDIPREGENPMWQDWQEQQSATFDPNGWPIEIVRHNFMMEYAQNIHWQLMKEK